MKKAFIIVIAMTIFLLNSALAHDIIGTWEGRLVTGPGAELTVQFIIEQKDNGDLTALLNSPDQGALKNIPANSVNFDGNTLKIEVAEVEGSFEGNLKGNVIDGKWSQSGMSFPLSLSPYEKPTLSRKAVEKLLGPWHGEYSVPEPVGVLLVKFRFEFSEDEGLVGYLDVPEQGAYGIRTGAVALKDNDLTILMDPSGSYNGKLSDNEIDGKWTGPGGQSLPLLMKKGEGKPFLKSLNLSQAAQDQLSGTWHGTVTLPQTALTIVFRFEKSKEGDFIGFLDIPGQGLSEAVISEASLEQEDLTIKLKALNVLYNGKLSGNVFEGKFSRGGRSIALSLKRGKPPVIKLSVPEASIDQLLGEWRGTLNTSQGSFKIALRFEKTEQGDFVGFYDNLDRSARGIPITEATLKEGAFALKIDSIRVEYKGNLSGNTLKGEFSSSGRGTDVVLERIM